MLAPIIFRCRLVCLGEIIDSSNWFSLLGELEHLKICNDHVVSDLNSGLVTLLQVFDSVILAKLYALFEYLKFHLFFAHDLVYPTLYHEYFGQQVLIVGIH